MFFVILFYTQKDSKLLQNYVNRVFNGVRQNQLRWLYLYFRYTQNLSVFVKKCKNYFKLFQNILQITKVSVYIYRFGCDPPQRKIYKGTKKAAPLWSDFCFFIYRFLKQIYIFSIASAIIISNTKEILFR